MQFWKFVALALSVSAQPASAAEKDRSDKQPVANNVDNSCLAALGTLGSTPNAAIRVVDGTTLKGPSDVRALRSKAKDGAPIIIRGGDFAGKKFGDDNFSNLCFDGTNLLGTRWSKSKADGAAFVNVNLTAAIFDRASLRGALFRNSLLTRMDASGANLAYGQFDGGWDPSIEGMRLENAQMTGFRFVCGSTAADGCSFNRKQISLRGANLTGAKLGSFSLWDANLVDVILNNTEIALDQIPQYANANVQGPVLITSGSRQATILPNAFQLAVSAFGAPAKPDTECNSPATPLSQIFCQAGRSALRAYRDDVDRLYQNTVSRPRPDGSNIVVTAPNREQEKYLSAMRKCALREETKALACLSDRMAKRRAALVSMLAKSNPLEPNVRALFVNVETPMLQAIARDVRLAGLTPLLIGSAPTFLLAYHDENNRLTARGVSQSLDGARCVYGFAPLVARKSRKTKTAGTGFTAWASGAEFGLQSKRKVKKKRSKRARTAAIEPENSSLKPGCPSTVQSGPLIRVPLSEDVFDTLWAEYRMTS
ncbi:MAG: pentapeptide repeat-containing protein [Sphingorhabdus sp.]